MPQYCLIKHRIENVTIDGADPDRNPDRMPVTGMVTFTPLLGKGDSVVITENGEKATLTLSPIEARITNGELWHRGEPGVKLFAGGPDTNPERIRYRAKFENLIGGGRKVELKDTVFEATPGGEMELSTVQPAPAQPYPGYTPSMEAAISEISAVRDSSIDYATTKIGEYRDEALGEADLAIQAAKDANTVPRVTALEALGGLSTESPIDGQTANLLSQPDTLTRSAVGVVIQQDVVSVGATVPPGFPEGKPVLWVDTSTPVEITPPAPELGVSWADLHQEQGVEWRINGAPATPGLNQVDSGISRISAHPSDGYAINSRSEWIDNFTDAKIIVDDFSGMDTGDPLAGRSTPQGGAVWGPPMGLMEGFPDADGMVLAYTLSGLPRVASEGGKFSHNTIRAGYKDFQLDFYANIEPSSGSVIGVNLRGTESSGDTGVAWRWRHWSAGTGFRLFRRVDGVNTTIEFPKPTTGTTWWGDVSVTVVGDQLTLTAQVGDTTVTDTVTYAGNPDSDLIRIASGSTTSSHLAYIRDLAVVPL